ncbi:MAG TPA: alpha/beta hydrolase [Syntrophorhabdaceae bacterium]|nr:alpha/beta hydrolase [Syntrophorhabdaceae bacterium]
MPYIEKDSLEVYYEEYGDGETIILLHHGFGCGKIWKAIYPHLVIHGHKVVVYDRRGFGKSDGGLDFDAFYESDCYRSYSVEELNQLMDTLGIDQCHLIGQCEGGVVAIDYAIRYPMRVKTLTAASTQCFSDVPMTTLNARKFPRDFMSLEPALQAKMIEWHGEMAEVRYNKFAECGGAYGSGIFDLRQILPLVDCPSLVLYPDRSSIFDVEQAISFYRHLSKGELAVFPRCGHNTYEQRPEDYIRTVLDFIARNTGEGIARTPTSTCLA